MGNPNENGFFGYKIKCFLCGEWVENAIEAKDLDEVKRKLGPLGDCPEPGCDGEEKHLRVYKDPYFIGD